MRTLRIIGFSIGGFVVFFCLVLVILFLINRSATEKWFANPISSGEMVDIGTHKLFVRVEGKGKPAVIIEAGAGAFSVEWWSIQDEIAGKTEVITYNRAGLGWSEASLKPRTPENIVEDLHTLLNKKNIRPPYVLVGHSQGGLYMQLMARKYPREIAGVVFLDPLCLEDRFKGNISPKVYSKIIDKNKMMRVFKTSGILGLTRIFRMIPPEYPEKIRPYIVNFYSDKKTLETALEECIFATAPDITRIRKAGKFPYVPVKVIYHSQDKNVDKLVKLKISEAEAYNIEAIWQESIQSEYMVLSPDTEWIIADKSTHTINFDQPELVVQTVVRFVERLKRRRR